MSVSTTVLAMLNIISAGYQASMAVVHPLDAYHIGIAVANGLIAICMCVREKA